MTRKELFNYLIEKLNMPKSDALRVMNDQRIYKWTDEQTVEFAKSLRN